MSVTAIRTLTFSVNPEGITPKTPVMAGVQGDHNATEVVFSLDARLVDWENFSYRFEYEDGAGATDSTEPMTPNSYGELRVLLPLSWTHSGGVARLRLVIARTGDAGDEQTVHTVCALLAYEPRTSAEETVTAMTPLLSTTLEQASAAVKQVQTLAEEAKNHLRKDRLGYGLGVYGTDDYLCLTGEVEGMIRGAMPKSGGTFTGQVKGIAPIEHNDLATKAYVDALAYRLGEIETALDSILAQEDALIGGGIV